MKNILRFFTLSLFFWLILTAAFASFADTPVATQDPTIITFPRPKLGPPVAGSDGKMTNPPVTAETFAGGVTSGLGFVDRASSDGKLSCVGSTSLFARIVYDALTIGMYEVARKSFSMTDTGTCNDVDPTITYKVLHYEFPFSWNWDTYMDGPGDTNWFILPPLVMQTAKQSDLLCVQLWMPLLGYQNIGCKYQSDPSKTNLNLPCFIAKSCMTDTQSNYNAFRITSNVIQCLRETVYTVFNVHCKNPQGVGALNSFVQFRDSMRDIVRLMLTLYVIFFGMKIALGGEMPPAGEVVTFGLKMVLVLYFSVGLPNPNVAGGYEDGVTTFVLPFFLDASTELADMMYSAGGVPGLCYYDPATYKLSGGKLSYLALWDSIDCRIAYYLGLNFMNSAYQAIWEIIWGALLGFQIVFTLVLIIFLVFFISIIVHFTHVFAISIIAIAILTYMAPLFVPFALFNQTKGFFDGWLKQLISFTLQPMIIAAFIALMLTVFDSQAYGTCVFETKPLPADTWLTLLVGDMDLTGYPGFAVSNADDNGCKDSFGYTIGFSYNSLLHPKDLFFFTINIVKGTTVDMLLTNLLTLVLFAFLFHALAEQVGMIAGDITGGAPLSKMAVGATAVIDKAAGLAKAYIKSKMGDKKGAEKELKKVAGEEGKDANVSGGKPRPGGGGADGSVSGGGSGNGSSGIGGTGQGTK